MQENEPVSQLVYDELKMLAGVGETCLLQFRGENGGIVTTETTITDVFEDETGQYLLAGNGLMLHLHQLIAINGKPLEHFC